MRGHPAATQAPKLMVPAYQSGTKRIAMQAAPQMPKLKSRPCGSNRAPGWPQKNRVKMSANTVDRLIRGEAPLRLSQVRQVLAACAISRKMVAEIIHCRSSSYYELTVPANLAPGVISALASKEGSQIRAVPCL